MLEGWLPWYYVGSRSCWELMRAVATLCPEDSIYQPVSQVHWCSQLFARSFSWCSPSLWWGRVNREDSSAAERSMLFVLSTLTTCDSLPPLMVTLPKKIFSQSLEGERLYGYKLNYLGGDFTAELFSKTIAVGSPFKFYDLHRAFDQVYSVRY